MTLHHFLRGIAVPLAAGLLLASCGGGGGGTGTAAVTAPAAPTDSSTWSSPASLKTFDLSNWKLNLPVDASGGTGGTGGIQLPAQTIGPDQLLAGFFDAWFHADAQGRIVFTAPANGAVTTPGVGTDYTRSELREFDRSTGNAQGDWTGTGTLSASCQVLQVATASPQAVIGQLRSEDHVFAELEYRTATREVVVVVYQANVSGSTHVTATLASNVALGQSIDYVLAFADGVLTATVDGTSRTFTVDAGWATTPLYFKLGAYHAAPNTGNAAGDATVVAFSRFGVTH